MILKSTDIAEGEKIDPKFTCDGQGISPQLSWEGAPKETKSFAISCVDPDSPSGNFTHWLIKDIPILVEGVLQDGTGQINGAGVTNDFGKLSYGGPCPPSGSHRYEFTAYALDVPRLKAQDKDSFFDEVKKHTLGKATITAIYSQE